jgi:hypothetical protein
MSSKSKSKFVISLNENLNNYFTDQKSETSVNIDSISRSSSYRKIESKISFTDKKSIFSNQKNNNL